MDRAHTLDVTSATQSFADLMLSDEVVQALQKAGFVKPSPVQQAALPLACLGTDLVAQAKSGTGKTVVFATCCLERVKADDPRPQVCMGLPVHLHGAACQIERHAAHILLCTFDRWPLPVTKVTHLAYLRLTHPAQFS